MEHRAWSDVKTYAANAMAASSFRRRFIAFCDLNRRQRELELLGQSDPKILSRWHEALDSLASCYQQAREREFVIKGLSDPYFPLSKLQKLNVKEFSREPGFADFSEESLAKISAEHLLSWAEIFLSIRQDLKNLNNHGEISTMRLLDPPQEPLPEMIWCAYCGGCCEIRGGFPDFSGSSKLPSLWYVYFRGDGCEYQRFCPFLFEYFATGKFFCAIYKIKPKCCWEFEREECEFLQKDVARERAERELARMFHELLSRDREDGRATGQPQGVGSEAYLNGTSQGLTPEDARKDGQIRGRSK